MGLLCMLRKRLCISPCKHCHCSTRKRSSSGNMATIHKSRYRRPKISQRCSIGDRSGALEGQSRVMTTVRCHIAGMGSRIFLLEEKINCFHQSVRLTDFFRIALASKYAPNYNQVSPVKYAK